MIRYVKKVDPQPLPRDREDGRPTPPLEPVEGDKKSETKTVRGHAPQAADDDHPV